MKTTLALLALASLALSGCALPPVVEDQAPDTPSKVARAQYDEPITGSRLPRKPTHERLLRTTDSKEYRETGGNNTGSAGNVLNGSTR